MKKIFVVTLLSCFILQSFAQKMGTLEVVQAMMQIETIIKYKNFKKDIEKQLIEATANRKLQNRPEDYTALKLSYTNTQNKFDDFLGTIKADMVNYNTVKMMVKSPDKFASKYMNAYTTALLVYQKEFLPAYMQAKAERTIPPEIIKLGIDGFVMLVGYLKKRSDDKKASFGSTLNGVNRIFFSPLRMKNWDTLVSYTASASVSYTDISETNTEKFSQNINSTNTPIHIAYPTVNLMHGSIEFVCIPRQGDRLTSMDFSASPAMRDLSIGTANISAETKKCPNCLSSLDAYSAGASFQIKVKNNAFIYVFAFNSTKKCYQIYPYSKEWVNAFQMSANRDLVIGATMLRDKNDFTEIPSKNIKTGEQNYINITGNSSKETLCVIVSKSELNMEELINKVDNAYGPINERINQVFGKENLITFREARLNTEGGKINFDADYNAKNILPFIFTIKRN